MAEVHRLRGENTEAIERFREAMAAVRDIVPRRPEMTSARVKLAAMNIRLGETELARTALETMLDKAPHTPAAIVLLAELDIREGHYPDAIQALAELAHRPPLLAVFDLLGQAYAGERRYEEATATFRSFAEAAPENRRAHYLLRTSLAAEGKGREAKQLGRAETALYEAVELQPDLNAAYAQLAGLLVTSDRADEAIATIERSLEENPDNVSIMMLKGMVQQVSDQVDAAQDTYEKVLDLHPRMAPAANNLAYIYRDQEGMLDRALELAEIARAEAPDSPDIADTLGWVAYKRGDYERALGLIKEAAISRPDNAEILYHLGLAHYRQQEFRECVEAFNMAIELDPDSPLAEHARTILLELE